MRLLLVEDEKRMAQAPQQNGQNTQKSDTDSNASNSGTPPQAPQQNGQSTQKSDAGSNVDNKEKSQPNEQSSISTSSDIAVGVSVLVLTLGLAFAVLFKRRKQ